MGMIFHKTLKCENCGYEYCGKSGGHIISVGEHYSVSQYCCKSCHSIIDLECYSSLKDNVEKYIYPDGTEISHEIKKKNEETGQENTTNKPTNDIKEMPPFCQKCGNHLFRLDIDSNVYACCPKCGQKSLKQKEIHITAYID